MIDNQEYQKAQKLIENYKEQVGCDIDIYPLEAKWLVAINKPQEAYNVAKEAIRKNPYNIEMNVSGGGGLQSIGPGMYLFTMPDGRQITFNDAGEITNIQ